MVGEGVIESWSRERARGGVRIGGLGSLPFDAAVGDSDDFLVGEAVLVVVEGEGGEARVVRVTPAAPTRRNAAFPYDLPIWRSSHVALSPSGARRAEIARATEHAMGGPTLGLLRAEGLALERCSPSFLWSDCSRYLAVPQLDRLLGLFLAMRMLVIDFEHRGLVAIARSKRYRGWLQPSTFERDVLRATLHPFSRAQPITWRVPADVGRFRVRDR